MSDNNNREIRELGGFTRVAHRGVGEVHITQGDREYLEIEANPEVRAHLSAEVVDGELRLNHARDWWDFLDWIWRPSFWQPIRFHVYLREITGINLSGAGKLTAGQLKADELLVLLTGAGSIAIDRLEAGKLDARLQSVGSIEIAGGAIGQAEVDLTGTGSYRAERVECQKARVRVRGVGSAEVWVKEELEADISGLGSINYFGAPRVTQQVNGLGKINGRGER